MQLVEQAHHLPLLALLTWAAVADVRGRRVANWLTLAVLSSGLAMSVTPWGALSPAQSAMGASLGFAAGLLLFAMHVIGGADGKLLMGIGAWLGPWGLVLVFAAASLVAMLLAVGQALRSGRVGALLRDSALLLIELFLLRRRPAPIAAPAAPWSGPGPRVLTIPYAVALLLATAGVIVHQARQGS